MHSIIEPMQQVRSISRRNSFSHDATSVIAQSRIQSFELSPLNHIQLHVNDSLRSLSPCKSASFTLPRSPQSNLSTDEASDARTLRATNSDSLLRWHDQTNILPQSQNAKKEELLVLDSPDKAASDTQDDESPVSSYSPASSTVDRHDADAFEDWLHESSTSEPQSPVLPPPGPDPSPKLDVSRELTALLQREPVPGIQLSKSVQQIELEIRSAIESAASRVSTDLQRRDTLHQQLQEVEPTFDTGRSYDPPLPENSGLGNVGSTHEPELLLLMEVLIGDGRSETIEVHDGDEPERLAEAFATKHGLGAEAIPQLTQHIRDQVEALADEANEHDEHAQRASGELDAEQQGESDTRVSQSGRSSHLDDWPLDEETQMNDVRAAEIAQPHGRNPEPPPPQQYREHEREYSYNHLMEKYGHYTSHSNKVNPTHSHKDSSSRLAVYDGEPELTLRNVEISEHTRMVFHPRPVAFGAGAPLKKEKDTVFNRLYSLAESREKWIRRQQKAKAAEEIKERQQQQRLEISAKSRDMVAGRTNGGFANIGERLHEEALAELAKKQREREKRALEKAQQLDWTCPKCAFVNQHHNEVCRNIVASLAPSPRSTDKPNRRESITSNGWQTVAPPTEVACGHHRPEQLFRPTLVSVPSNGTQRSQSQQQNKLRASTNSQSQRRLRTQRQMEDEFKQTCPFRPKINELSDEIMRDKLEQEGKAAGREHKRNPHLALYEDAFHARAQREAREQEYLSQFPFKPNIGVNTLWSDRTNEDVVERLAVSKYQELERKRQSLHEKYAPDRDPTTGRPYFQPETGRAPIFNRNERGLPIGDFLYEAHKEQAEYHRRLKQHEEEQIKQQSQQRYLSDRSKEALKARKKRTFARIFDYVAKLSQQQQQGETTADDPDESRVIPDAVDLDKLPSEVARVVGIVFEFANRQPFAFADFEQYMEKLMHDVPGFTYTQVLFLAENLNDGKSTRPAPAEKSEEDEELLDPELTFHPSIDKNSDALAKKHGRADRTSVFEALNQYFDHYKQRKEQIRKHQEREFTRSHPFQPTFVSKDRKAKAAAFYNKLHQRSPAKSNSQASKATTLSPTAALRTAVPNARPFVRPIERTATTNDPSRSRSTSLASSKHSDDDDAALTSRVLAALDDRPQSSSNPPPSGSSGIV